MVLCPGLCRKLVTVALCLWASDCAAASVTCTFGGTIVTAEDPALARAVCRAVDAAAPDFACFGLSPLHPVRIEVVADLSWRDGTPLALYDARIDLIEVLNPEAMADQLTENSPYRMIPVGALFDSLVMHELAHAVYYQVSEPAPDRRLAQEYISYAMQYTTLSPDLRSALLDQFPRKAPVAATEFSVFYADVAPIRFGTKVWRHFSLPQNGCDFVRSVLNGGAVLGTARER